MTDEQNQTQKTCLLRRVCVKLSHSSKTERWRKEAIVLVHSQPFERLVAHVTAFSCEHRAVSVGSAGFFFSEPSEVLPGFKYTLAPESQSEKRGISLEIGRKWLQ